MGNNNFSWNYWQIRSPKNLIVYTGFSRIVGKQPFHTVSKISYSPTCIKSYNIRNLILRVTRVLSSFTPSHFQPNLPRNGTNPIHLRLPISANAITIFKTVAKEGVARAKSTSTYAYRILLTDRY